MLAEKLAGAVKREEEPLSLPLGFGYIIEIFCLLGRKDIRTRGNTESLPENILALKEYIDTHFTEIESVGEVAEQFFYSREYISRLFKKYYDTTVMDYIHELRVAKAKSLIGEGLQMIDVCYAVGYSSLSTFVRVFRRATDMTPSEYRKLIRE